MTRFTPAFLAEIRSRVPVSKVVGRMIELKPVGGNDGRLRGYSPFVRERTPSFFVDDRENTWVDFAARMRGDVFKFIMLTERLSFPDVVERLAREAGLEIPRSQDDILH